MFARRANKASPLRHLVVILLFLGYFLDVLPTPTPGSGTLAGNRSNVASPFAPRPDDTEPDETPDEAGELSWPQSTLVASMRLPRPPARAILTSHFGGNFTRMPAEAIALRRIPHVAKAPGSPVALSILVCRLIC